MEIEKEGLHTYGVAASVDNPYFLSVEYPVIRHNHPERLLPILLREQDGDTRLLYDLSDARSLAACSREKHSQGNNFSREDCQCFLRNLQQLLRELDELMLSPTHISFSPDRIYRTGEAAFRWMYCPDEEYDMGAEVQQFFSWMLSEINYGDSEAVRYIYHVYWMIRNRTFSETLIQECLDYEEETAPNITSYESFFAEKEEKQKSPVPEEEKMWPQTEQSEETEKRGRQKTVWEGTEEGSRKKASWKETEKGSRQKALWKETEKRSRQKTAWRGTEQKEIGQGEKEQPGTGSSHSLFFVLEVILGIATALTGVTVLASAAYSLWYGLLPIYNRYWIACVILCVLLVEGMYQIHKKRKRAAEEPDEKQSAVERSERNRQSAVERSERNRQSAVERSERNRQSAVEQSEGNRQAAGGKFLTQQSKGKDQDASADPLWSAASPWDEEEGTVRLDMGVQRPQPVLKSEESGEVFLLQSFPFYIGNHKGLNQLTIYDNTVSREHAVIERGPEPETFFLRDLQSTNGTWVNQVRVESGAVMLKDGDSIRFASHTYRFRMQEML